MSLSIKAVGRTDLGLVRSGNEDCIHLDEHHHVYAVCDGMGGHQAGEVASLTASETVQKAFTYFAREILDDKTISLDRTLPPMGELLVKATRLANRAIYNKSREDSALSGMGTTIVAVAIENDIMSIVHVGDSRAYRIRERELEPLTRDHSWVAEIQEAQNLTEEEANSVVGKNVITRALGVKENVEADYRLIKVKEGDRFMLCSDGLCGFADDDEIFEVIRNTDQELQSIVDILIQMANDRGGADNVSVIALEITSTRETPIPELDALTFGAENIDTLGHEDDWLDKFAEFDSRRQEKQESESKESGGTNKVLLLSIFVVFAVVAAVIIWMQIE